jgi:AraC-like DNA-binding protein
VPQPPTRQLLGSSIPFRSAASRIVSRGSAKIATSLIRKTRRVDAVVPMGESYGRAVAEVRSAPDNEGSFVDKRHGRGQLTQVRNDGLTLPLHYVRHIADQVRRRGADVGTWLAESGLSEAQLARPTLAIDFDGFATLVRNAIAATREPALGLFVGEGLVATAHGMLGYAALSSGTVRQALEIVERFTRIRTSLVSVSVERPAGAQVRLRYVEARPLGDIRRPVLEAIVLCIKNILGTISMGACRIDSVTFPFAAPAYAPLARQLFQCDVAYGRSSASIVLPEAELDAPLAMGDPEAFQSAALVCQRELDKLTAEESMAGRIRRVLLEKQAYFPSLPLIARQFHMTPRTLHRRLVEEGTSYRELLEVTRHALAVEQMKSGRASVEEIAYGLGYSDLANFRRAFKRWEGIPPSEYARKYRSD